MASRQLKNQARSEGAVTSEAALTSEVPLIRIAPGPTGVSIWSEALFARSTPAQLRQFLSRAFSVDDVTSVEIRRADAYGRIHYRSFDPPHVIWRRIARAIGQHARVREPAAGRTAAETVYLDGPPGLPIEVTRIGSSLSSWRVRHAKAHRVRLVHPILLRRRDVAFRLEHALMDVLGVRSCRTSIVTGGVAIRFDPALISAEQLVRKLEQFWPVLLTGLDGPPSNKRLVAAGGLFTLAAVSQFLVPALRPFALLGVAIYGFPNVIMAFRQALRLQVGLPALYSFGLTLMLLSGSPFNSTVFAVLMQMWPRLAHETMSRSQRRLFAVHRQQATWARLQSGDPGEIEIDVDALKDGDVIVIRTGDIIPVDGTVVEGLAAVDEAPISGVAGAVDKAAGDFVYATSYVRDGHLLVRVGAAGPNAVAGEIARFLPHTAFDDLPSALEAERISNRNAKPALALAVASLFTQRLVRLSQAIIRPDYITAHRLGAQLATLHDFGDALHQGILFRRPHALDVLAATDIYVIDESPVLERRRIEVAEVLCATDILVTDVLRHAAAAYPALQNERARALQERCSDAGVSIPAIYRRRRIAGAIAYDDDRGRHFEVASAARVKDLPAELRKAVDASGHAETFDRERWPAEHLLRPLLVRRDGKVIGAIAFARSGELEATETLVNLRTINRRARFVHVSGRPQAEAEAVARTLGIDIVAGGLDAVGKARAIRELGPRTMWIGDGASPDAGPSIGAASVSISVAGFTTLADDQADIVFLQPGLQSLLPLRRIARAHRVRLDEDYRAIYAVNLLGVAGGIFANFGGLQSGLVSNAGTAWVYLQHRKRLRRLVAQFEARRALLATAGREDHGRLAEKVSLRATDAETYVDHRKTSGRQPVDKTEGV